jgi:cyanate permease
VDIKIKISILWIVVMLNLIFVDILSIIIELVNKNTLGDILGEVEVTMAIAALLTNIPILMIYFSRIFPHKINRSLNISAAILTLIYVIGGGSLTPHYIICGAIEVIVLLYLIKTAWKWVDKK